jgi:hypothetical protein
MIHNDKSLPVLDSEFGKPHERIGGRPSQSRRPGDIHYQMNHSRMEEVYVMPVQFFEKKKLNTHAKVLINAVLDQAFDDLRSRVIAQRFGGSDRQSKQKLTYLRQTYDWFLSTEIWCNGNGYSFEFICQHLDYDVKLMRATACKLYQTHPFHAAAEKQEAQRQQDEIDKQTIAFHSYYSHSDGQWRTFLTAEGHESYFLSRSRAKARKCALRRLYAKGLRGDILAYEGGLKRTFTIPELDVALEEQAA